MRLLVVEDDPDLNRQLVSALTEAGYAVDKATDGEEGHFLGDPLLRIVRRPVAELKHRIGPLLSATTSSSGGGVGERAASLSAITGMIARAAGMLASPGKDPVVRLRKRLGIDPAELERLEQEVEIEVRAAVQAGRDSSEEAAS